MHNQVNSNSKLITAAALIVALAAVAGIATFSFAAQKGATGSTAATSVQDNLSRPIGKNLTDEQKQDFETQRTAVQTALDNNNYADWVKAVGEDAPILQKINAGNFAKLVEAHKLQTQARTIFDSLGISDRDAGTMGCGGGGGCGMHRGFKGGSPSTGGCAAHLNSASDTSSD